MWLWPEGAAYLAALRAGLEGGTREVGYEGLLHTVRREREYHAQLRPSWQQRLDKDRFDDVGAGSDIP